MRTITLRPKAGRRAIGERSGALSPGFFSIERRDAERGTGLIAALQGRKSGRAADRRRSNLPPNTRFALVDFCARGRC